MNELKLISGMTEWRQQHPKATLREMEVELDGLTYGGKALKLKRQYAHSPACGAAFFPSGPGIGVAAQ